MKKTNQRMQSSKRIIAFATCSLLFSATAIAQPTTYGSGAGGGGNATNSYYGAGAGAANTSGQQNVYIGDDAGRLSTSNHNTFVGSAAGLYNTTGTLNTFIGYVAGLQNTTGTSNTCIGPSAGAGTTTGSNNVFIGRASGYQSNGSGNTFVGTEAAIASTPDPGNNNTSLGYQSSILNNPTNATAIGYGATATASNSCILGNTSVSVGIGVTAPVKKLTISSGATNDGIRITQTTYGYAGIELFNTTACGKNWGLLSMGCGNTQGPGSFAIYNYSKGWGDFYIDGTTGNTTIGYGSPNTTYKLDVNGSVRATAFVTLSDKRFKKDIEQIASPLQLIKQLNGVTYNFRDDIYAPQPEGSEEPRLLMNFPKEKQMGFIAQDVEKVLPEVVSTDGNGYKGVLYQNIVPLLIEGIKEQQGQIAQMSQKMEELQTALASLQQCCSQSLHEKNTLGTKPSLEQNIPNPLNKSALIRYSIGTATNALMQFTNMEGRVVLSQKLTQSNNGQLEVNTESWATGIYTYSLVADGQVIDTKKMVIAR
jgi:trimeric autotransporter adhesin